MAGIGGRRCRQSERARAGAGDSYIRRPRQRVRECLHPPPIFILRDRLAVRYDLHGCQPIVPLPVRPNHPCVCVFVIECRFLRGLIARRVGMLGWKLRVKCWTQDVGRHEWHTCTVTSVCVPPLHSSTAMHGDSTASALVTRPARGGRSHARDTSKSRGPGSCERSAGAGEDLGPLVIEHQVQWDADEVAFAACHSNACSHPGASKWMRALHVLHVLWSRDANPSFHGVDRKTSGSSCRRRNFRSGSREHGGVSSRYRMKKSCALAPKLQLVDLLCARP